MKYVIESLIMNRENFINTVVDQENVNYLRRFLKEMSLERIINEIELYQDFCIRNPNSFIKIEEYINNTLFNVKHYNENLFPNFKHKTTSVFGDNFPLYFFRVRNIEKKVYFDQNKKTNNRNDIEKNVFEEMNFPDIQTWNDVWEKPKESVTNYQRLSKPLNSVLYTSLMPSTAILETNNYEIGSSFFLIIYKSKRKITYSDCSSFVYYQNMTEDENMKRYIIFQFLVNEFARVLPNSYDSEIQYCAAAAISRKFFINEGVDGIQYPSTRGLGHKNFGFWSESCQDSLEFIGIRCCGLINNQDGSSKQRISLADGFWNNELRKFEFVSPSSEKSKQVYDDFLLSTFINK